jgi:hypothetical protein
VHGREIYEALSDTGVFPREFLDTLEVGERAGRLPESMAILSRQYQEQARRSMATLTVLAGFGVWAMVAALIILMIFRTCSTRPRGCRDHFPPTKNTPPGSRVVWTARRRKRNVD